MSKLTLEKAKELLQKHTTQAHLFQHAAAVSACMGGMAALFGADAEHWQAIGWLHDVDYEDYPSETEHCHHVREYLAPEGVDEEDIRTIISHGYGITTDEVAPETDVAKSLFTVDELTGLVAATARMRPGGLSDLEPSSVKKKFKDKKFAAKIDRPLIQKGCDMLGMELTDVIAEKDLFVKNTSGSVNLDGCDAGGISIETTSGAVKGTLLTDKIFMASSSSGRVEIPRSNLGGDCEITTTSGSIRIEIAE